MTDALGGSAPATPTLKDDANASRIGRARFIGHSIGFVLIVAVIEIGLTAAGLKQTLPAGSAASMTLPNHWVILAGSLLLMFALLDLAVRRRHDRGRSGIDAVLALLLLEAALMLRLFGLLPPSVPPVAVSAVAGLCGLYLLLMLVLLPGSKSDNRYGPPPPRLHD
jgi:uncharacterized membrane protein YhaH (DUF805 family)